MAKLKEIIEILEVIAPPSLALSYDNAGLNIGEKDSEISGVTVCLDATEEVIEEAIENAKLNAEMNGRSQGDTLFLAGDARIGIEACKKAFGKPDVIVVDPPRKGLEAKLIEEICDICPDRVVYISCNPSTLARDVALFAEKGFLLKKIQAVDLFPRTTHVETVVLLSREVSE